MVDRSHWHVERIQHHCKSTITNLVHADILLSLNDTQNGLPEGSQLQL